MSNWNSSANVVVQVTITDKNDNPMVFSQDSYSFEVKETASIGEVIMAVTADDKDEGEICEQVAWRKLVCFL